MKNISILFFILIFFITGCENTGKQNSNETVYSSEIISLVENLGNENKKIVLESQEKLLELEKEALPVLIEALKNNNYKIRGHAAYTIGLTGSETALEPLIMTLEDKNKTVKLWTIIALGKLKNPGAADSLKITLQDEDKMIRAFSAQSLAWMGDEKSVKTLREALKREREPSVAKLLEKLLLQFPESHGEI